VSITTFVLGHVGQAKVDKHHVRQRAPCLSQGLCTRSGLADDLDLRVVRKSTPQPFADDLMIIDDADPHR
jgi:hypothetical protein